MNRTISFYMLITSDKQRDPSDEIERASLHSHNFPDYYDFMKKSFLKLRSYHN